MQAKVIEVGQDVDVQRERDVIVARTLSSMQSGSE